MRLGGRNEKRRRRELALWCRQLALLLANGTDLVTALSVLERQDFDASVRRMTTEMIEQAGRDVPLADLFASRAEVFPPVFLFGLRSAQAQGRTAETLADLAECLWQAAELGMTLTLPARERPGEADTLPTPDQTPVVRMVDSILRQALKIGASEVDIRRADDGRLARIAYNINGKWEPMTELPIDTLGPICRRICILAKISWWFREPALGTLSLEYGEHRVDASVRFVPGEAEDEQEVCVTFANMPEQAEPS
jgi:type II secretory ATPase GspE/PulE/Tfp pilus assembly ATPase PilB-like protein